MSIQEGIDVVMGPNDERHHSVVGVSSLKHEAIAIRQLELLALWNTGFRPTRG
jgi:hypothetical protein